MDHSPRLPDTKVTPATTTQHAKGMTKSMHDGIAIWCDCCSCEMEPYWAEVAMEMGVIIRDHEA
jgi:hypothetical protein